MIGQKLRHFHVIEKIGAGGMGVIYRAQDEQLGRDVAIKILASGIFSDDIARKQFRKEALTLSKLNHPNIETVHEFNTQDGIDFLVMEYIPGLTLSDRLVEGPLQEKEILRLGVQLADGLNAAHEQRVLHRDLKPSNLQITADGRLKILDFGLAKFLPSSLEMATTESFPGSKSVPGTLPYMAPEQLRGEKMDMRSDIYSAGAVLYEMATARRPFIETQVPRLVDAILHAEPDPPGSINHKISAGLEAVILKALDKDPDRRYQSAREFLVDLQRLTTPLSSARRAPVPILFIRTHSFRLATTLFLLIAVLTMIVWNTRHQLSHWLGFGIPRSIHDQVTSIRQTVIILPFKNKSGDSSLNRSRLTFTQLVIDDLIPSKYIKVFPYERLYEISELIKKIDHEAYDSHFLRKVGQFGNSKMLIQPTIFHFGNVWQILLEFQDAATGETVDSRKVIQESNNLGEQVIFQMLPEVSVEIKRQMRVPPSETDATYTGVLESAEPGEALILYNEGLNHLNSGNNTHAVTFLSKAIQKEPNRAIAYAKLAIAQKNLGYDEIAAQTARSACDLMTPKLSVVDSSIINATLAEVTYDYSKAIEFYNALARIYPDSPEFRFQLGFLQEKNSEFDKAFRTYSQAIELDSQYAPAYQRAGIVLSFLNRTEQALTQMGKALRLFSEMGNSEAKARTLAAIGNVYQDQNSYPQSRSYYQQALEIDRAIENESGIAEDLRNLGISYMQQGDMKASAPYIQESTRLLEKIGNKFLLGNVYIDAGHSYVHRGKATEAVKHYDKARQIAEEIKSKQLLARVSDRLSQAHQFLQQFEEAMHSANRAKTLYSEIGDKRGMALNLRNLGDIYYEIGSHNDARKSYQQSLEIGRALGDQQLTAINLGLIGNLSHIQARYREALSLRNEELRIFKEIGYSRGVAYSQLNLAHVYARLGAYEKALSLYNDTQKYFMENDNAPISTFCLSSIGKLFFLKGDYGKAEDYFLKAFHNAEDMFKDDLQITKGYLCVLWSRKSKTPERKRLCEEVVEVDDTDIGQKHIISKLYLLAAIVSYQLKNYDRALMQSQKVIQMAEPLEQREDVFSANIYAGRAKAIQGHTEEAFRYFERASEVLTMITADVDRQYLPGFCKRSDIISAETDLQALVRKAGKSKESFPRLCPETDLTSGGTE